MNNNNYYQSRRDEWLRHFQRPTTTRQRPTRDQRLVVALCHVSILLNIFTYAGGIAFCALFYLLSRNRVLYVAEQASRSLVFQGIVWGIIAAGWLFYRLLPEWLAAPIFWPLGALVWFIAIIRALWRAARCL